VKKVNFAEKLAGFDDLWVPKVVAELNGQLVKVAKCKGEYVWHHHENEDEAFLVLGRLDIHLREGVVRCWRSSITSAARRCAEAYSK